MIDAKITIDVSQALAVLDKIEDTTLYEKMANAVADEDVLPALQKYPTASRKKMEGVSAKQRAYVMAAIRDGRITVPYQRSGDYGRSFQKQAIGGGLALVSELPYAEYVRGPGQAAYHKGTWDTLDNLATAL